MVALSVVRNHLATVNEQQAEDTATKHGRDPQVEVYVVRVIDFDRVCTRGSEIDDEPIPIAKLSEAH